MYNKIINNLDFAHKYDEHVIINSDFTKHMHPHCELLFLMKGDVKYNVEASTQELMPYDVVFIMPGQFHFGAVNESTPYERYVLKFPLSYVPSFLKETIKENGPFFNVHENLLSLFKETDRIVNEYNDLEQEELLLCVIKQICIELCKNKQQKEIKNNNEVPNIVTETLNYISTHITENITLEVLSEKLYFSIPYLCESFSKYTKTSLIKYIRSKKIIAANEDIITNHLSATEAASKYGYLNYSTFYRNYVKIIGHSPTSK